jgi:hypothetical protein
MKVMRIRSNAFYHRHFAEFFKSFSRQKNKNIVFYFSGRLPEEEPPGCVPYLKKSRQDAFLT